MHVIPMTKETEQCLNNCTECYSICVEMLGTKRWGDRHFSVSLFGGEWSVTMQKTLSLMLVGGLLSLGLQPVFAHGDEHHDSNHGLKRQEKQIHKLQRQGLVSPQQHAATDVQLQQQHQMLDSTQFGQYQRRRHGGGQQGNRQSTWLNQRNPNYGYYQTYNQYWQQHPQEHRALEQSEQKYHQLVAQGVLTEQEHAMLDAQLQAQHAQADGRLQNNFNTYGYPYVNQQIPGIINKLRTYWGF
jgi:hypothetical protein